MHALTARAIADLVGGTVTGPDDVVLCRIRSLERAGVDALAPCLGERWSASLAESTAGAVLLPPSLASAPGPRTRIVVSDPAAALALAGAALHSTPPPQAGIHPSAILGASLSIGQNVAIAAGVVVGDRVKIGSGTRLGAGVMVGDDSVIGNDAQLDPHVVVYPGTVLGDRVRCQAGAVIGGEGFGFRTHSDGHQRLPHLGGCLLEDDVEVGSGCCIDRGTLDDTVIGAGTKLDNLVHIGHNVRLGRNCLVAAGVAIAGSTQVGDRVVFGGQAGLAGHLRVGDDARIAAQAGVIGSVPAGTTVSGYPARPHREFLRAQAALYRLADRAGELESLLKERNSDA